MLANTQRRAPGHGWLAQAKDGGVPWRDTLREEKDKNRAAKPHSVAAGPGLHLQWKKHPHIHDCEKI